MEQQSLFGPVDVEQRSVKLENVQPEHVDGASNEIRKSVQTLGTISTPLLRELPDEDDRRGQRFDNGDESYTYEYEIIDGHRRLQTFREEEIEEFLALVVPADADVSRAQLAAMRLVRNENRSPNPLQQARAAQEIIQEGGTEKAIAEQLGIPLHTVRKRLRLAEAPEEILDALGDGDVSKTVASRVANMSDEKQTRAVELLAHEGELTGPMLDDMTRAKRAESLDEVGTEAMFPDEDETLDQLDDEQAEAPEDDPEVPTDPIAEFEDLVWTILQEDDVTVTELRDVLGRIKNDLAADGLY